MSLSTAHSPWYRWILAQRSRARYIGATPGNASLTPFRPVNVNPLIVETPEEKRLFKLGERNSKIRKQRKETALIKHTPNDLESDLIHAFWQKQLLYHDPYDEQRKPGT